MPRSSATTAGHTHPHAERDAQHKAERLADTLEAALNGADEVAVTVTRKARVRYQLVDWSPDMTDLITDSEIFVVISPAFVDCLPVYDITPLAQNIMLRLIGRLRERDEYGQLRYFATDGEIRITQQQIADLHKVERASAGRAIVSLSQRGFVWTSGRGKIQINPHVAYFGPADVQAEAIVRIASRRPDKKIPHIYPPGSPIMVERPGKKPVLVIA